MIYGYVLPILYGKSSGAAEKIAYPPPSGSIESVEWPTSSTSSSVWILETAGRGNEWVLQFRSPTKS